VVDGGDDDERVAREGGAEATLVGRLELVVELLVQARRQLVDQAGGVGEVAERAEQAGDAAQLAQVGLQRLADPGY
jgi:hypothetical protein